MNCAPGGRNSWQVPVPGRHFGSAMKNRGLPVGEDTERFRGMDQGARIAAMDVSGRDALTGARMGF